MTNHERRVMGEFLTSTAEMLTAYGQAIGWLERAVWNGTPLTDEDRELLAQVAPQWRQRIALQREAITGVRAQLGCV